jgi:alpha-L-fucosidase 2
VAGLRARGGFEVDIVWRDGRITSARVRSVSAKGVAKLRYGDHVFKLRLKPGEVRDITALQLNGN